MYEITPIITTEEILSKISQEQLWEYYLGMPVEIGKLFLSPLREEDSPSANLFYAANGTLLLKDFGYKTMNIWQYIQYIYNISFGEALLKVSSDLVLDKTSKLDPKPVNKTPKRRDRIAIDIRLKRWNDETLKFWNEFHVTLDTLKAFKVVPIDRLWVSGEYIPVKQPAYSYEFSKGYRKIYMPYSERLRFISNVPGYMYSGYEQLPWVDDLLIITKSHKDVMVWRELGYYAISPQGEGHKIDTEFLFMLKNRFKKIVLNYDNDKAGILHATKLAETEKLDLLFIPEFKDISDYIKHYDKEITMKNCKKWLNM